MISVWRGIEKEAVNSGSEVITLFICADELLSFSFVHDIIVSNPEIKRLYFGAGRKKFCGLLYDDWDKLVDYCSQANIQIAVEVEPVEVERFIKLYNNPLVTFIVAYYNMPININNLYFKTDDFVITKIYSPSKNVDITSVRNDRYPDDIMIYEEC